MTLRMNFGSQDVLRELQSPDRAPLRRIFTERAYGRREIIFTPHHPESIIFIVASGLIRVYLAHEDKELTLSILKPGGIYSSHTPAFVRAVRPAVLLEARAEDFRKCVEEFPELTYGIIQVLGSLLRNAFSIIQNLAFKNTRKRITEFFLHEVRKSASSPRGALVESGLTVEEIAAVVGASRQTVSTLLNDMIRDGLIVKRSRGSYLIPDVERLEASR
ncbi:helix-turn-helix domain-containing protein [Desulfovibrio aminophilus]|uniref:Crp/Fnr family transcriptional regulator n=1 Tax=Desulfovibrio aminophilus TaxID=81425 RepID=UPI003395FE7B